MRRTKIIVTLGPSTDDAEVLADVLRAGADVARINFSHGETPDHRRRIEAVRAAAARVGRYVGVMGDLQGPKIRISEFKTGKVTLENDQAFFLDPDFDPKAGTIEGVNVGYTQLPDEAHVDDRLALSDGQIELRVERIEGRRVHCIVEIGGVLASKKGVNRRGGGLSASALTDDDRKHIRFAADMEVDFLAVSFTRDAEDIREARRLLSEAGGQARIIAKIERAEAIDNIESIIRVSDIIMVARGDLSVEVGYAELTALQKNIIRDTRHYSKIGITATQMMESMTYQPMPTRAEVSDVANAVMDGSDAVMLSGETAIGDYPVQAVEAMSRVCEGAEKYQLPRGRTSHRLDDVFSDVDEAIAMAVMYSANHLDVKAIIALTESGSTALWMSRIRSDIPIYAFTRHEATRRRVTLYRGVYPVSFDVVHTQSSKLYRAIFDRLLQLEKVEVGERVIFTKGDLTGVSGGTNSMTIVEVTAA